MATPVQDFDIMGVRNDDIDEFVGEFMEIAVVIATNTAGQGPLVLS